MPPGAVIAYIGLGSNLQDPLQQLRRALASVAELPGTRLLRASGVYSSAPMGPSDQPDYLNAVLSAETSLPPLSLLDLMLQIERRQGRVRRGRWRERTLDLDLLLYGELTIDHPRLQVPHPGLAQRHFVLYPLAEIAAPGLRLPGGAGLETLLAACPRGDLEKTGLVLADSARESAAEVPDAG